MDQPIEYATPYQPPNADQEHLRLLRIFHFVLGGLFLLFGCFPIIHVAIGMLIVTGKLPADNGGHIPPSSMGYLFVVLGIFIIALFWVMALCLFMSGWFLGKRQHYMFSFVVAALSCLQIPLGTVLGVFTIMVLSRPSVKAMYGR